MVCLACSLCLRATPVIAIDARTGCGSAAGQIFCNEVGRLSSPSGTALPATLANLTLLMAITGEGETQVPDRSIELSAGDFLGDDSELPFTYAPLVVGPQMICSIQVSFDPRLDLSRRGAEGAFEARRSVRAGSRASNPWAETLQYELTLGTVMSAIGSENKRGVRAMEQKDYVSFALVNQFHIAQPVQPEVDPAGEDELNFQ